jgi:phosphatidylglycerol:prolipoprotein diacylglycerol transferase
MIPYFYVPFFNLGLVTVDTHPAMAILGMLLGHFTFLASAHDRERAAELSFYGTVGGVFVAHLSFLALSQWRIPFSVAWFPLAGMLTLPGFIAAFWIAAWRIWIWGAGVEEIRQWGETAARAFPPAWIVVKSGCFLLHDTPGPFTSLPWAVEFPDGPRHDLALYEILWAFVMLLYRGPQKGRLILFSYGVLRFVLYWLRLEQHPIDLAMSIAALAAGLFWPQLTIWWAGVSAHSRRPTER